LILLIELFVDEKKVMRIESILVIESVRSFS